MNQHLTTREWRLLLAVLEHFQRLHQFEEIPEVADPEHVPGLIEKLRHRIARAKEHGAA
jgi:hypothetical protein